MKTYVAFVADRLGTQICMSSPSPSYAGGKMGKQAILNVRVLWRTSHMHSICCQPKDSAGRSLEAEDVIPEGW